MKQKRLTVLIAVLVLIGIIAMVFSACKPAEEEQTEQEPKVEQVTDREIADFGTFTGTLIDGKPSGTGKLVTSSYTYEGTFENGFQITGTGIKSYNNGQTSKGTFVNNKLEGFGMHDYNNGCIGIGEWKNGTMNGTMWFTWGNSGNVINDVYIGKWENGVRKDTDAYYFWGKSGQWYRGAFNDWINGQGEMHYAGGNWFRGNFVNGSPEKGAYGYGQMDGKERYIYADDETGKWRFYTGKLEDGTDVVNGLTADKIISKEEVESITAEDLTVTADGTAKGITATVSDALKAKVSVTVVYTDGEGEKVATPTAAGVYTATFTIAAQKQYGFADDVTADMLTVTATLTINAAE